MPGTTPPTQPDLTPIVPTNTSACTALMTTKLYEKTTKHCTAREGVAVVWAVTHALQLTAANKAAHTATSPTEQDEQDTNQH